VTVALGALLLLAAFAVVRTIFPTRPGIALTSTAFIAFLPQHVAMTAGVNNDVLGELAVASTLWLLVRYVNRSSDRPWTVGLLLGIALLTKTTAYISLGTAAVAVGFRWRRERWKWPQAVKHLAWMFVPAMIISAAWFIRNGLTYGWPDLLGLSRHEAVVAGQPLTMEWVADLGWTGLLTRLVRTTFQSFWGQFGWMGVLLPTRLYQALVAVDLLLLGGFLWWLVDRRRLRREAVPRLDLALLGASCLFTVLAFLWYNLTFVQHQGRYLFPALVPIGAAVALGLHQLARLLPESMRDWGVAAALAGLALLDLYALFRVIVPTLAG
jgi:hypothetical protein